MPAAAPRDPAFDAWLAERYDELRALARHRLHQEPDEFTLQATGLVHEAYARLRAARDLECRDAVHFDALMARNMRRVLVDRARRRRASKRGEGVRPTPLNAEPADPARERECDLVLAMHEALTELATRLPGHATALEMRYFGQFPTERIAAVTGHSATQVERKMRFARGLLRQLLRERRPDLLRSNDLP